MHKAHNIKHTIQIGMQHYWGEPQKQNTHQCVLCACNLWFSGSNANIGETWQKLGALNQQGFMSVGDSVFAQSL